MKHGTYNMGRSMRSGRKVGVQEINSFGDWDCNALLLSHANQARVVPRVGSMLPVHIRYSLTAHVTSKQSVAMTWSGSWPKFQRPILGIYLWIHSL